MHNRFRALILLPFIAFLLVSSQAVATDYDLDDIKAFAKAEVTIERLRKQKPVDWEAIVAQYEICSPLVKIADVKFGLTYEADIREAIKLCMAGVKVRVNQQVLAKGLQHVVTLFIQNELARLSTDPVASKHIAAFFEGIRPTFVRRDGDFFSEPTLEPSADQAIAELRFGGSLMARSNLLDAIHRAYALSVLYEIIQVEKLRADNRPACEVKVMEAIVFYRVIEPRVRKTNSAAHEKITAMLAADFDAMDASVMEEQLQAGLRGITLR